MTKINIAPERLAQIMALTKAKGFDSISDLLADFVRKEIAAGTISNDIPGVEITADGEEVRISTADFSLAVHRHLATVLGQRLQQIAAKAAVEDIKLGERAVARVSRKGRGVQVLNLDSGEEYTMPTNLAHDLGSLIVAKAEDSK